jgi:GNAT superfamily N-acetyltransferase
VHHAVTVTRLNAGEFRDSVPELAALLADIVADGASLGFVTPFDRHAAEAWWYDRHPAVTDGTLTVWAARGPAGLTGTIGLARPAMPNGRHRAEIVKLMVRPDARGQGLARTLLATAEEEAAKAGTTLLMLDTETGGAAEALYRSAGWTRYGTVPGYATDPAGVLRECSFFYKRIT